MKHRWILSAVVALIAITQSSSAEDSEPAVWRSKSGASFEVRKTEEKNGAWVLSILEGNNFGTITIRGTTAVKEVMRDLSRFRIEGNAPRTHRVEGRWDNGVFTFGNEVYEQVASPPQASIHGRPNQRTPTWDLSIDESRKSQNASAWQAFRPIKTTNLNHPARGKKI